MVTFLRKCSEQGPIREMLFTVVLPNGESSSQLRRDCSCSSRFSRDSLDWKLTSQPPVSIYFSLGKKVRVTYVPHRGMLPALDRQSVHRMHFKTELDAMTEVYRLISAEPSAGI